MYPIRESYRASWAAAPVSRAEPARRRPAPSTKRSARYSVCACASVERFSPVAADPEIQIRLHPARPYEKAESICRISHMAWAITGWQPRSPIPSDADISSGRRDQTHSDEQSSELIALAPHCLKSASGARVRHERLSPFPQEHLCDLVAACFYQ